MGMKQLGRRFLMAKPIPLSFKNNDKEIAMYEFVKAKYSPSAYIKDLIERDMNGEFNKDNKKDEVKEDEVKPKEIKKSTTMNLSALKNMGR